MFLYAERSNLVLLFWTIVLRVYLYAEPRTMNEECADISSDFPPQLLRTRCSGDFSVLNKAYEEILDISSIIRLSPMRMCSDPNKANQDSFAVVSKFHGDPQSLFCGVFDGHGGTGDLCSRFVADHLPKVRKL